MRIGAPAIAIGMIAIIASSAATAAETAPCELRVIGWTPGRPPGASQPVKSNAFVKAATPSDDPLAPANLLDVSKLIGDVDDQQFRSALSLAERYTVSRDATFYSDTDPFKATSKLTSDDTHCYSELVIRAYTYLPGSITQQGKNTVNYRFSYRVFDGQQMRVRVNGLSSAGFRQSDIAGKDSAAVTEMLKGMSAFIITEIGQQIQRKTKRSR